MDLNRSLGWCAVAWIEQNLLHGNGDVLGQSMFPLTDEYAKFIVMVYALEEDGTRCHDSGFLSRPKGCSKSEIAAVIGLFDALGPSRFDHWAEPGEVFVCPYGTGFTYEFEPGEPVGKRVTTPIVQCIATEAGQAGEIYSTILFNAKEGPLAAAFPNRDDVGLTRINLPGGGSIKPLTASGDSKDGGKATLTLFDEAIWVGTPIPTPSGLRLMGELEAGDEVLGRNGEPVRIMKATEWQHDRDCFDVKMADGEVVTSSDGHLWLARPIRDPALERVWTTGEMYEDGRDFEIPLALTESWTPIASITPTASVAVRCRTSFDGGA